MRCRELLAGITLLWLACCSGEGGPAISMDTSDTPSAAETADGRHEVCSPNCEGKECGANGCGGECGVCEVPGESCSDDGQCMQPSCKSTKDCPGQLVCDQDEGVCVVCNGDEDCPDGEHCGADHDCHGEFKCSSDLECKDKGMVCDKAAGLCVECLGPFDCAGGQYCEQGFCLAVACPPGTSKCEGNDVVECSDGSGWVVMQTCTALQYCEEGACVDCVCEGGAAWCDGEVPVLCDEDCKSAQQGEDCAAKQPPEHCFNGACIESVCIPNQKFCIDGQTAATCFADGMKYSILPCEAQQYCKQGECFAWVCEPGQAVCEGTVASTCNSIGSGYITQMDCDVSNKVCDEGQCKALECTPNSDFCADSDTVNHCAPDGMSFASEDCSAQHSCMDGACQPWICVPGELMCDGDAATTCGDLGLEPQPGGTNCSTQDKFCLDGECVENCESQPGKAEFEFTGEVQEFVVPECVYAVTVKAIGAAGGKNIHCTQGGGKGAQMQGSFDVSPGDVLSVVVGERGTDWGTSDCGYAGSGGGGTFVWRAQTGALLVAAGGGGGGAVCKCAGSPENAAGLDAPVGPCGSADKSGAYPGGCDGKDGMGEAAGLGWNTVFVDPSGVPGPINGGYGGGGVDPNEHSGGGGGGYGGGGGRAYYDGSGSYGGGGGGSFNAGVAQISVAGVGKGDGSVVIAYGGEIP